jgi:hypothetical protein
MLISLQYKLTLLWQPQMKLTTTICRRLQVGFLLRFQLPAQQHLVKHISSRAKALTFSKGFFQV